MRRLKKEVKEVLIFILVLFILVGSFILYAQMTRFDFGESLPKTVVTINEEEVSLQEMMYYIMRVEVTGQQAAMLYNSDNPKEYWGLYMNEREQAGYVSDLAKRAAMEYCIRDYIYAAEAEKNGIALTEEEQEAIRMNAEDSFASLTPEQRETSQMTWEVWVSVLETEALAYKYMLSLAEESENPLEALTLQYDVGGEYYTILRGMYQVEIEEELWEEIRVGYITINQ